MNDDNNMIMTVVTTDEHQNNLNIINNSTNKNHKENGGYTLADSDISIISGNDYDNDQHQNSNHIKAKMTTSSTKSSPLSSKENLSKTNPTTKSTKQITDTNQETFKKNNHINHQQHVHNKNSFMTNECKLNEAQQQCNGGQNMSQTSKHSLLPLMKKKVPINVLMGSIQLLLSITMVALACLSLAREATLANACSGLWAGAIAAIAGSLGVMNMVRAQSAFLAMSLVCVASSTLALAITGIGVVRDSNVVGQEKSVAAVTAGSGLIFILTIHFFISVFSVYHSTLKLCTRQFNQHEEQPEVGIINNGYTNSILSQMKVEEYIKSITEQQKNGMYNNATIISNEKMSKGGFSTKSLDKKSSFYGMDNISNYTFPGPGHIPIMLVPAGNNRKQMQMMPMFPPAFLPPPPGYIMQPPPPPPEMQQMPPQGIYDIQFYNKLAKKMNKKYNTRQRSRAEERQREKPRRRKSEGDVNANRDALVYKGLDRAIAEDYLMQQEKHNHEHHESVNGDVAL